MRACNRELETEETQKERLWSQRENEVKPLRIRQQHRRYIHIHRGRKRDPKRGEEKRREDKSALVKIQGRRWRRAIITIHQDNK